MRLDILILGVACCLPGAASLGEQVRPKTLTLRLHDGWTLQSSCKLNATGAAIASTAFDDKDWLKTAVPATVLAAQVAAGIYKEPFVGTNLRSIPGTTYPIGENFSNLPMSPDSPYRCSWWYRKAFTIPSTNPADAEPVLTLHFGGLNYRGNIWLNGRQIADADHVAGAYRTYDFDVTAFALRGRSNVLAVETFAPTERDLGINWVDWSPCPPDKDMGLWGNVDLEFSRAVTVRSPLVTTHFAAGNTDEALLTVEGEFHNHTGQQVIGTVNASLLGAHLEQQVTLQPNETKTITFTPENFEQLSVKHPELWWPLQMGAPHLDTLTLSFMENGRVSDEQTVRYGIREITSELTDKGFRLFRVNGKPILIRGAGWSQDMLLRESSERLAQQFELVRDMHLNTIRLEGKMETEDFFRLADEQGILVMAGWCCCDHWEHWDKWTPADLEIATQSLRSQLLRIRHHASLLVWLNGSDGPPPRNVESAYLALEKETHWPNPTLSSAAQQPTGLTGSSGVKMTGPYDYVAPSYWLVDESHSGGAYGFNTETGPGPAIPTLASLKRFIPADHLWPPDDVWSYHNGGEGFKELKVFRAAMDAQYGPTKSLDEYEHVAQAMAFDGERAMFEAYGRNKYTSTGVIQWMLNNAWPSMIWHLYDYYLAAGGGYFGTKKACEPVHIQYSYDDRSVVVVNSLYTPVPHLRAVAHLYDLNLKELFSGGADMDAAPDSSTRALSIPDTAFAADSKVYFVQLTLKDQSGASVSDNFYWLPSKLTQFEWSKTDYTHTPAAQHEDLTALRTLPAASLSSEVIAARDGSLELRLHNVSQALAFQVSAAAQDKAGDEIAPVFWSDNYVELMPGESRVLRVRTAPARAIKDANEIKETKENDESKQTREAKITSIPIASIKVSGWNVPDTVVKISQGRGAQESTIAAR